MAVIVVKACFDSEAQIWFVESSDVPGLNVEADTVESLVLKLPGAILDLLDEDGRNGALDVPVEVIAHASTKVRREAA